MKLARGTLAYAGAFEADSLTWMRSYARRHRLSLRVVMNAAVAEYAARRTQSATGPEPQLKFTRGYPTRELMDRQRHLMRVDPRGRRLGRPDKGLRRARSATTTTRGVPLEIHVHHASD
jgi:hypothetical protein